MTKPASPLNCDSPAFRYALLVYREVGIQEFVIVIHDEYRGPKQNIFFQNDAVLGRYR
jgi:hypothetical protein